MSQGMKEWEPEPRQFVVRFKCGCCVRFPEISVDFANQEALRKVREHVKCDMVNGCYFSEELVQVALEDRIGPSEDRDVEWGWEHAATLAVKPTDEIKVAPEILADAAAGIPRLATVWHDVSEAIIKASYVPPAFGCKLTLEEAKRSHRCRVCGRRTITHVDGQELDSTIPPTPLVLHYGKEFAHSSCLVELKDITKNPAHADGGFKVPTWLGKELDDYTRREQQLRAEAEKFASEGLFAAMPGIPQVRFVVEETVGDYTLRLEAPTQDELLELVERWHKRKAGEASK